MSLRSCISAAGLKRRCINYVRDPRPSMTAGAHLSNESLGFSVSAFACHRLAAYRGRPASAGPAGGDRLEIPACARARNAEARQTCSPRPLARPICHYCFTDDATVSTIPNRGSFHACSTLAFSEPRCSSLEFESVHALTSSLLPVDLLA